MAGRSQPVPETPLGTPPPDPLAVALGNASLLGIGYLLLGRRRLALAATATTVALLAVTAAVARRWCEPAVLAWWLYLTCHGWLLAVRHARRAVAGGVPVRGQRLVALGVTVPVVLALALLRFDAARLGQRGDAARQQGDCATVLAAADRLWAGHRVANAATAAHTARLAHTCRRLASADDALRAGLDGDLEALDDGFATLAEVLAQPGNRAVVDSALDRFLAGLPTDRACRTATVTDWLRAHAPRRPPLDRSAEVVRRTAPQALLACGDDLMASHRWRQARQRFSQLLDRYPDHRLAARARDGVRRATLAEELARVRALLEVAEPGSRPPYCSKPARYSGAKPYRRGVNRALFYGNDEYTGRLPDAWRATDPTEAVLVVCAEAAQHGTAVRTCPYESKISPHFPREVTFHRIAIPVKVYELRTGRLVTDRTVQIDGASCPRRLEYTTHGPVDLGPPSDVYVTASKAQVRAAFEPLVRR